MTTFHLKPNFFDIMRQKIGGKPSIDSLCFTANISEVRFSARATKFFQHTEGPGPPYENLGTVRQKMRQKTSSYPFWFLSFYPKTSKNRMSFQQIEGAPNEYFGISRHKN